MNRLERAIAALSPNWAARRAHARMRVLAFTTAYEAAKPSRLRKWSRDFGSGTTAARWGLKPLRDYARNLERNHDIAGGALNVLVQNIVGGRGIGIEPQPQRADGTVDVDLQRQLQDLWNEWSEWPEVSWTHSWASAQRMLCRSWVRDGEVLFQMLPGKVPGLQHGSRVPLSIELIEADLLDHLYDDPTHGIVQGVERNAWNRPIAYHVFKQHPGDYNLLDPIDRKRVSADLMYHIKLIQRIAQARGISVFASVCARLDDIKDYEDSERIAAKVAASMAAVIKKGTPDEYTAPLNSDGTARAARDLKFTPGMIFDDLLPGEDIATIDSNRPNPNVETYRNGQLRAVAAGVGTSYSSLSKHYDGTYSAQRQELVEQWGAYLVVADEFIAQCVRPVYQQFVNAVVLAGLVKIPRGSTARMLQHATYVPPSMPWIDPLKEAQGWSLMELRGYISAPEIIRRRGGNPADTLNQEANWRQRAKDLGLDFSGAVPAPASAPDKNGPALVPATQTNDNADGTAGADADTTDTGND